MRENDTQIKNNNRAYFVQRLAAYMIDVIIVLFVASLLSFPFQNDSVQKLTNQSQEIMQKYMNQEITMTAYMSQSIDLSYQLAKQTGFTTIITILIYVLYYIVFQFYKDGQTLGKMLLKIKIIKSDASQLTMNDLVIRNIINNSILCNILVAVCVLMGKNIYFYGSAIIQLIQYIVLFVSIFMIIIRKDGRSVSDLIAGTKVINMKEE